MRSLILSIVTILFISVPGLSQDGVTVTVGTETIPTYEIGPAEKSPVFYTGRAIQLANGAQYPYPVQNKLSQEKVDKVYTTITLENKYLKVVILPEIGGKLHRAVDKTNGYEIFHRNSVIKPALIGTLGAWVSGGIEWGFPHHHRTTTFMPANYDIEKHEDGSITVWTGETEHRENMKYMIGVSLEPERSYLRAKVKLFNNTPVTNTFQYWANVSTEVNKDYEYIFPPSTDIVFYHYFMTFSHWPVSHTNFMGADYTEGVDISWWKNNPKPTSFFIWNHDENFIAGYDHGKQAGTIHYGNPNILNGAKVFAWGPGKQADMWRSMLTDNNSKYSELMVGAYSNNQPDYNWFMPGDSRIFEHYWYPLRNTGGVKNATNHASVNLDIGGNSATYGFNATSEYSSARMELMYDGKVVSEKQISVAPGKPVTGSYQFDHSVDNEKVKIRLVDGSGAELVAYQPADQKKEPTLPEKLDDPKAPEQMESVENLYLTGRFAEQFHNPFYHAQDFYYEALQRDPSHYKTNIALGRMLIKKQHYAEAEKHLRRALKTLTQHYEQPKEGEVYYYLGLALLNQGNIDDAYDTFYRASWYYAWRSQSYLKLAYIESRRSNYDEALRMVNEGLAYNTRNLDLKELKVMLLHKLDENDKAVKTAEELLDLDPINYLAMHVRDDITGSEQLDEVHNQMAYPVQEYIDMAVPYLEAGLYKESTDLLSKLDESSDILINYYRAYSHLKSGEAAKAETFFEQAHNSSIDYAFPFRNMSRTVLEAAVQEHPNDEKVHYLLGNLLYDDKPAEAIAYWEQASSIRPDFAMNIRNRAFGAFYHENDPAKAVDYMQQAISLNPDIALWYTELSEYYEKLEPSYDKQLDLLEDHEEVVLDGTDSKKKLVRLYTLDGQYDKAIDILKNYHFRIWEGGRFNYWKYVDALVLRAQKYINNGEYELAVDDLNDALKYPENLEVGEPLHDERDAQIYFTMAQAYEGMGKKAKAQDLYQKIVGTEHPDGWQDMLYYQGQAFSAMGDRAKARASYFELLEYGQKQLDKKYIKGFFPFYGKSAIPEYQLRSKAHYYIGLARLGLNDYQAADEALQKALEIWPNNLWAQQALTEVQQEL